MLIVGNGTLCAVDGIDAAARGIGSGNVVVFICHLNLVAWARLVTLVLKELVIRYGPVIEELMRKFVDNILGILTPMEKDRIQAFYKRLSEYDDELSALFAEFVKQVEKEYAELYYEISETFSENNSSIEQANHSIRLAEVCGVDNDKIIRNHSQLDDLFG
jgi:hypothetical protein